MKAKYGELSSVSEAPFPDVSVNHALAPYITKAKNLGVVVGYSNGDFRPNSYAKRGEVLKIVLSAFFTVDEIEAEPAKFILQSNDM